VLGQHSRVRTATLHRIVTSSLTGETLTCSTCRSLRPSLVNLACGPKHQGSFRASLRALPGDLLTFLHSKACAESDTPRPIERDGLLSNGGTLTMFP